jgi:hypothetical protein
MLSQHDIEHQVLEVILRASGCTLEEIVLECANLTWNQVFFAVDRMTRSGELRRMPKGRSLYMIHLLNNAPNGQRCQQARV